MSTRYEALEVRSHLAANTFLTRIVQLVRPNQSFTYLDVASAFRLPTGYVSKMLSRLAKRRLLHAHRIHRFDRFGVHRGFLNVYSLSERGLGKARYLLGSSFPGSTVSKEDLLGLGRAEIEENFGLTYLVNGMGTKEEYAGLGIPIETVLDCPPAKARKPNVGAILIGLNGRCVGAEMGSIFLKHTPYLKDLDLWPRLIALSRLRLTPTDVNPLVYAMGARYLGRTDEEIVIALLARRCVELNTAYDFLNELHFAKSSGTEKADHPEAAAREPRKQESRVEDSGAKRVCYESLLFLGKMFMELQNMRSDIEKQDLVQVKDQIKNVQNSIMNEELSLWRTMRGVV